jgi:pimeloyl-[acyl-carrier protein] methyl ester esterase
MTFAKNVHLVFMPGLDGTGLSAGPLMNLIPPQVTRTIVHYPTDKLLSFAETVECAAEQFPPGIAPVVIAESFSGPVAIQLIASGLVQAGCLILCATFARSPHPLLFKVLRGLGITSLIRPEMPKLFFNIFLGREFAGSLAPLWRRAHADVPVGTLNHRLGIINRVDVTMWLNRLTIPCLYLQATADRIVPSSCFTVLAKHMADMEIRRIRGPHFILQAQPQACLAAIEEFVERYSGAVQKRSDARRTKTRTARRI